MSHAPEAPQARTQLLRRRYTKLGAGMVLISIGVSLAAYNTNHNILFIALSLLLAAQGVNSFLAWRNLRRIEVFYQPVQNHHAHEITKLPVIVLNQKNAKTYNLGLAFELVPKTRPSESPRLRHTIIPNIILPFSRTQEEASLGLQSRGQYQLNIKGFSSDFPFGFIYFHQPFPNTVDFTVWPALVPIKLLNVNTTGRQVGLRQAQRKGSGQDLYELRPYRLGDPLHSIHWKASARSDRLISKDTTQDGQFLYDINLDIPSILQLPAKDREAAFEKALSVLLSLASHLVKSRKLASVSVATHNFKDVTSLANFLATVQLNELSNQAITENANMLSVRAAANAIEIRARNQALSEPFLF